MAYAGRPKRLPRNYQLVNDVVNALPEGEHAAAGEIYAAARLRQAGIGYSTVYRALDRLALLGLVLEVRVPGSSSALYEAARPHHAHFRCGACGGVTDVDYAPSAADVAAIADTRGIRIEHTDVTFTGLCAACAPGPSPAGRTR